MATDEFSGEFKPKTPAFDDGLDDFYPDLHEAGEKKFDSALEADMADFNKSMASWKTRFDERLVPTAEQVPEGYEFYTNSNYSPFNSYLIQDIELQQRGAPILFCREARGAHDSLVESHVALYVPEQSLDSVRTAIHEINFGSGKEPVINSSPAEELTREIDMHQFNVRLFRPEWVASASPWQLDHRKGFVWAMKNGLAESAFMTSTLLWRYNYPYPESHIPYEEDSYRLYEKFAAEQDDEGNRKYRPLSLEQIAGMAVSPMYQAFQADPSLNERLRLERPFPTRIEDEDSL